MRLDVDLIDEIALVFVEAALQDPEFVRFMGTTGDTSQAPVSVQAYSVSERNADNNEVELLKTRGRSKK
jgi:hypothetical protein